MLINILIKKKTPTPSLLKTLIYIHFQGFKWQSLFLRQGIQLRALLRRAPGGENAVAPFGQQQCGGPPQSIASPGNQDGLCSALGVHLAPLGGSHGIANLRVPRRMPGRLVFNTAQRGKAARNPLGLLD